MLLDVHKVKLPSHIPEFDPLPELEDNIAVQIIELFNPIVLRSQSPRAVIGDGNCMFRAISLAMYGTQDHHILLRLLVAIEIAQNRRFYDNEKPECKQMVSDEKVFIPHYYDVLLSAVRPGTYTELIHMLAASAVLRKVLQSYYPPAGVNNYLANSYTRKVIGRNVRRTQNPVLCIMWSQLYVPR